MPTATHFRLRVFSDKPLMKLSLLNLYSGNMRVDQGATLTAGFAPSSGSIASLKDTNVVEGTSIDLNKATTPDSKFYFVWQFSTATHVDTFRIGSADGPETYVDQFILESSSDGVKYTRFINITNDKKLGYPGPWQLSELKPVGQSFPALFNSLENLFDLSKPADDVLVGPDGRSLVPPNMELARRLCELNVSQHSYTSQAAVFEIPGHFTTGKFYLESLMDFFAETYSSLYGTSMPDAVNLCFIADNDEKAVKFSSGLGPLISLIQKSSGQINGVNSYSYVGESIVRDRFVPGYQCGFGIDFDNRELTFVNPSWSSTPPASPFVATNATTVFKTYPVGTKYKAFIVIGFYALNRNHAPVYFNFGQNAFNNAVPSGFHNGFGPRWKEERVDIPVATGETSFDYINRNYFPANFNNKEDLVIETDDAVFDLTTVGVYYIKGNITRQPNIDNKKLEAQLFSVKAGKIIKRCKVSSAGLYEFYGIEYGAYVVLSVDLLNNTVSESLGPIFPLEIQE